jgi:hypothetical protein
VTLSFLLELGFVATTGTAGGAAGAVNASWYFDLVSEKRRNTTKNTRKRKRKGWA